MPFRMSLLSGSRTSGARLFFLAAVILCVIFLGLDRTSHTMIPKTWAPNTSWMPSSAQFGWSAAPSRGYNPYNREPVVFTLISWFEDTAVEYGILFKTILMYTNGPVEFHLLVDDISQNYFEHLFMIVERPAFDVKVFYYHVTWEEMFERMDRVGPGNAESDLYGAIRPSHQSGPLGIMKLFLHELFPESVKRGIFIDSDAFIMHDPITLWRQFERWTDSEVIAIPRHEGAPDGYNGAVKLTTAVLLLDFERMRKIGYMYSKLFPKSLKDMSFTYDATLAHWGEPDQDHMWMHVDLGDQGFYYGFILYRPELHARLPLAWELTYCMFGTYGVSMTGPDNMTIEENIQRQLKLQKTPEEGTLLIPNLVHWNCLQTPVYFQAPHWDQPNNEVDRSFGHSMRYHQHYKWAWLNKGDGSATILTKNMGNVSYWDMRQAGLSHNPNYEWLDSQRP